MWLLTGILKRCSKFYHTFHFIFGNDLLHSICFVFCFSDLQLWFTMVPNLTNVLYNISANKNDISVKC